MFSAKYEQPEGSAKNKGKGKVAEWLLMLSVVIV